MKLKKKLKGVAAAQPIPKAARKAALIEGASEQQIARKTIYLWP
jgi:hypothetical protein